MVMLAVVGARGIAAQTRVDRGLAADHDVSVRIFNPVGFTRIVGWDVDSVGVSGTLPADAGPFVFGGDRRAVKLGIDAPLDSVSIAAATLEIRVPRGARVWVRSTASPVEISGVTGELDVSAVNGRIRVEGAPRRVVAETVDGNIELEGQARSTRIRTAGGMIVLRYVRGELDATSVTGSIRIGGAAISRGRLESVSGEISYKGDVLRGGTLEAQSHRGEIELRLPPAISADFDLTAHAGAIESELGGPAGSALQRRFSVNGGAALITARTYKGTIRVLRQPLP